MPALLSVGWRVLPLSLPVELGGCLVEAAEILIEQQTFDQVRRRAGGESDLASSVAPLRSAA
jgi:hypothetical protein